MSRENRCTKFGKYYLSWDMAIDDYSCMIAWRKSRDGTYTVKKVAFLAPSQSKKEE